MRIILALVFLGTSCGLNASGSDASASSSAAPQQASPRNIREYRESIDKTEQDFKESLELRQSWRKYKQQKLASRPYQFGLTRGQAGELEENHCSSDSDSCENDEVREKNKTRQQQTIIGRLSNLVKKDPNVLVNEQAKMVRELQREHVYSDTKFKIHTAEIKLMELITLQKQGEQLNRIEQLLAQQGKNSGASSSQAQK